MTILKPEEEADIALLKAKELEMVGKAYIKYDESNKVLRESLEKYLIAFWVFKDEREDISSRMHKIGKIIHDRFGCPLKFSGTNYYNDCPVDLSHVDFGFSWGGEESIICSICGKDPIDCDHIPGDKYNHVACDTIRGSCNICWEKKDHCPHILSEYYDNVEAIGITIDMKPTHVAMVSDPACPFARIQARPILKDHFLSEFKNWPKDKRRNFVYGKSTVYCHHCCECNGIEAAADGESHHMYLDHSSDHHDIPCDPVIGIGGTTPTS